MKYILLLIFILSSMLMGDDTYDTAKKAEKDKDYIKAEKFYRKACDMGNDKACLGLVNLYFNGKGEQGNMIVAYKLSKMLCNKNDTEGCFFLGYMYSEGKGTSKDENKAKEILNKACDLGEYKACMNLAKVYATGTDYVSALKLYEKAYNQGSYLAGAAIGGIYFRGMGVAKNVNKAIKYLQPACEKGMVATSCALLGGYYLQMKNYSLARKYTAKTCNMEPDKQLKDSKNFIAESCANLGLLHAKGLGGEQSMYKARKYFRKACDMGLDTACKYYNKTLQY